MAIGVRESMHLINDVGPIFNCVESNTGVLSWDDNSFQFLGITRYWLVVLSLFIPFEHSAQGIDRFTIVSL